MLFSLVNPLAQFADVHRSQLGNVLVPNLIRQGFAVQPLAVTLGARCFGQKLVGPLLACCRVIVLHDLSQVLDDAIERNEVVACRVYQFFFYAHVFQRPVEHLLQCLFGNVLNGRLQVALILLEYGVNLPENHLVFVLAQWYNAPFVDVLLTVGDDLIQINLVDVAQSFTMGTCPLRRVERKVVRCWITVAYARRGTHQSLGEELSLIRFLVENHDESLALLHSQGHRLLQAVNFTAHRHLVNDHFDVVVLVAVHLHASGNLLQLSINADVQVALAAHVLE